MKNHNPAVVLLSATVRIHSTLIDTELSHVLLFVHNPQNRRLIKKKKNHHQQQKLQ